MTRICVCFVSHLIKAIATPNNLNPTRCHYKCNKKQRVDLSDSYHLRTDHTWLPICKRKECPTVRHRSLIEDCILIRILLQSASSPGQLRAQGVQNHPRMHVVWISRVAALGSARGRVDQAYQSSVRYQRLFYSFAQVILIPYIDMTPASTRLIRQMQVSPR